VKISPDDYINAARERIATARELYSLGRYVDCVYSSGVSVECVLRAYAPAGEPFDGRHDLKDLLKGTALERFIGSRFRQKLSAALGEVWEWWKNNYRYASEDRLRAEFKKRKLDRKIKGDFLKKNARIALENALTVVNQGAFKWKNG
jgi:HEPN domain-containing protein